MYTPCVYTYLSKLSTTQQYICSQYLFWSGGQDKVLIKHLGYTIHACYIPVVTRWGQTKITGTLLEEIIYPKVQFYKLVLYNNREDTNACHIVNSWYCKLLIQRINFQQNYWRQTKVAWATTHYHDIFVLGDQEGMDKKHRPNITLKIMINQSIITMSKNSALKTLLFHRTLKCWHIYIQNYESMDNL